MRLVIAGSRSITEYKAVRLAMIDSGLWKRYKREIVVICGMAPGVDSLGLDFAKKNSLTWEEHPADWDDITVPGAVERIHRSTGQIYNVAAGYQRNQTMAETSDGLLLVWDGVSTGSKDMLTRAKKQSLEIHAYTYKKGALCPM